MIDKLRKNFTLTNILVRVFFVLAFVFANWQVGFQAVMLMEQTMLLNWQTGMVVALLSVALLGTIWMFLVPVVVGFALNAARFYSVPRAEYCLLAQAAFALGYFILGLLKLVNLFTPVMLVWGGAIFPLISSLVAALLFYKVTSQLYFNDLTTVYYFKSFAVTYLVILIVLEVL